MNGWIQQRVELIQQVWLALKRALCRNVARRALRSRNLAPNRTRGGVPLFLACMIRAG
jgi:hypothetical protein